MKRQNLMKWESLYCSWSQSSVHLFFCGIGGSGSLFRCFNGRHLNRNTQIILWEEKKKKDDLNWWMSHFMKKPKRSQLAAQHQGHRSWCHGGRNTWFQIKQRPFYCCRHRPLWRADWGALRLAGSTYTAHALSLWQALCAGDGVGLPRSIATNLNFQLQQASLVSSHYGANNGPPHSRMFKDSISIGARPVATLSNGMHPKDSAMERSHNGRLLRDFHRVQPFKLWIHDSPEFAYSNGSHAKKHRHCDEWIECHWNLCLFNHNWIVLSLLYCGFLF